MLNLSQLPVFAATSMSLNLAIRIFLNRPLGISFASVLKARTVFFIICPAAANVNEVPPEGMVASTPANGVLGTFRPCPYISCH